MTRYELGNRGVSYPFYADNDDAAVKWARAFVKKGHEKKFLILNNETGRIFNLVGDDA